jgi:hypothetical protein
LDQLLKLFSELFDYLLFVQPEAAREITAVDRQNKFSQKIGCSAR